jgi:hypothetical protein
MGIDDIDLAATPAPPYTAVIYQDYRVRVATVHRDYGPGNSPLS